MGDAEILGLGLTSLASAFVPVINIEAILVAAVALHGTASVPLLVSATVGQVCGKAVWYWGGRSLDRFGWFRRRMEKPKNRARLDRWHHRVDGRPWLTAGLLFVSALTGFPPYAVMAVLAGLVKVRFDLFLVVSIVGRGARFAAFIYGADWLIG